MLIFQHIHLVRNVSNDILSKNNSLFVSYQKDSPFESTKLIECSFYGAFRVLNMNESQLLMRRKGERERKRNNNEKRTIRHSLIKLEFAFAW